MNRQKSPVASSSTRVSRSRRGSGAGFLVTRAFDAYSPALRRRLLQLRKLIFSTAAAADGVGEIEEALRWGQPAYLTPQTKSGSTIRLGSLRGDEDRAAIFFHCQTNLIERMRRMFGDLFEYEGNRAILVSTVGRVPLAEIAESIRMALLYHRSGKK